MKLVKHFSQNKNTNKSAVVAFPALISPKDENEAFRRAVEQLAFHPSRQGKWKGGNRLPFGIYTIFQCSLHSQRRFVERATVFYIRNININIKIVIVSKSNKKTGNACCGN